MSAASSIANGSASGASRMRQLFAAMASRPLWLAFVVTALLTALRLTGTVDSDVAWQLWIARQMHAGANLYTDIIETNPPLWFWMAMPVDRAASLLGFRSEDVLILTIGGVCALSLCATDRLTRHIPARHRILLLAYEALALMGMPWMHLGQREQIVLIGTVPYAALVAARREGKPVGSLLAVLVGIGAALGFALKHYFLLVPGLLELWLLAGLRKNWRPIRPETTAIVSVGAAYTAAIILLERDFLTNIVPLLRLAYGVFGPPSLRYLFGPFALAGLLILGVVVGNARLLTHKKAPFAEALLVAATAFSAVYFIQFKGWLYHAIPLLGFASLALAALLAESREPARILRLVAPAILAVPLFLSFEEWQHQAPDRDLQQAISGLREGDTVGFLSENTALAWSVTLQHGFRYASRYNGLWMMSAIVGNESRRSADPRLTALGLQVVAETVRDFGCAPPKRIIVSRPRRGEGTLDMLAIFNRDPGFRDLMSHYKVRSRSSLETFEIISPLPRPTFPCRTGV